MLRISVSDRPDLSGEYRVRDDGRVSMHLVDALDVRGSSAAGFERRLEALIPERTGLDASVTVEVVAYRPYYVLGDVAAPGSFAFQPGTTVLQALARAGGYLRFVATDEERLALRVAEEAARARLLRRQLTDLLAVRRRLEAEAAGAAAIAPSAELDALAGAEMPTLLAEQAEVMRWRGDVLAQEVAAAKDQSRLAQEEAGVLRRQGEEIEAMITVSTEDLATVQGLFDRGLASSERLQRVRNELHNHRNEALSVAAYTSRAAQVSADATARVELLTEDRGREIAESRASLGARERELRTELAAAEEFILAFGGHAALSTAEKTETARYQLSRAAEDGRIERRDVAEDTRLLPGDVLEVLLPVPEGARASAD